MTTTHTLLTAAETLTTLRRMFGTRVDVTNDANRALIYTVMTRRCPTNDPRQRGEQIPTPPAAYVAKMIRELQAEAAAEVAR